MRRSKKKFYGAQPAAPDPDQQQPELDLNGATSLAGLVEEIALLRALVKRAVQTNRDAEARRLVAALCAALRLQQALAGGPVSDARQLLNELLDEVGRERIPPEAAS